MKKILIIGGVLLLALALVITVMTLSGATACVYVARKCGRSVQTELRTLR